MTVSSQTSSVAYSGDGSTAIFAVPFYFLADSHLKVILRSSAGSETVLVLNSDYTVTGVGNLSGGSITVPNEPQVGETLTILRNVPATQETDYVENDPFPAESHERALDKLTMLVQQAGYSAGRAIRVPDSDPEPQRLPPSEQRANMLFSFDASGQPTVVAPVSGSATDLALNLANSSDPLKGAAIIGRGAQIVDSVADLRNLSKTSPSKYAVTVGYYGLGTSGSGLYWLDESDLLSADNGGTVIVATDGGRWKLVQSGPVSILQFGAKADDLTDSSANVAAAIAELGYAFVPADAGTYIFGDLTLAAGQRIYSDGKAYVKLPAAASYGVRVTSFAGGSVALQGQYAEISGIHFDGAACPTTTTAIRFGTSTGVVFGFRSDNLMFSNLGEAIGDEVHASNFVVDIFFQDCTCIFSRGRQVYLRRSRGFITFRDFRIDHTYNTSQVTWGGARFDDLVGLELEKFDVVGPIIPTSTYQAGAIGLAIVGAAGSASVWLRRLLIDNTRGPGLLINGVQNVFGVDTVIYQNLGPAVEMINVSKSEFTNTKIVGGKGLTGAPASANGLSMSGCSSVTFTGLEVEDNTGSGVVQVSCTDCSIIGGYSNSNTGIGYIEVTAATRNLRSGVRALSNTGGSLTQIGAQCATTSWWPNSGTFTASTVGAATIP